MKPVWRGALLVVAALVATVLGVLYWKTHRPSQKASTVALAITVALTGDGADWGQTELNAVNLAVLDAERTGKIPKGFVVVEANDASATDVASAVSTYRRSVALQTPYAVIGPTWDDSAAAIAPVSTELQEVTISPDASSGVERKRDYPYFFSTFAPEAGEMAALTTYLSDKKLTKAAIVYNQDPFSQQLHDEFRQAAIAHGLKIIGDFPIADPDARDFRGIIARLNSLSPDVVYIEMTSQGAKGPFMQQIRELGATWRIVSSSTTDTESLLKQYGSILDGIEFASARQTKARASLEAEYKSQFGQAPASPAAPYAYDAAGMLISAIRAGVKPGAPLRTYLLNQKSFEGASASDMRFDGQGRIEWPLTAYELRGIKDGKVQTISAP
jgi:ABC-type branched-subunit amino acid transport system substrate-binding protein